MLESCVLAKSSAKKADLVFASEAKIKTVKRELMSEACDFALRRFVTFFVVNKKNNNNNNNNNSNNTG